MCEYTVRLTKIGLHHRGALVSGQNGPAVRDRHRIVVHVDHAGLRILLLSNLVHVADSGNARADVEELRNPLRRGVADYPTQKGAIALHDTRQVRPYRDPLSSHATIDPEIVRSAQVVVVHPRHTRTG